MLSREQQEDLKEKLLAANPAELKVKIKHDADIQAEPAPIAATRGPVGFALMDRRRTLFSLVKPAIEKSSMG
jgi:hypothetical protein